MRTAFVVMITMLLISGIHAQEMKADSAMTGFLNIPLQTITGDTTTLVAFHGKVILIVNVASRCGYTPQYKGLESLYREYMDRGFVIIGFPANNFKNQEPGSNKEILEFCRANYDVTFPMMSKISVKGDDQHPLYSYLTKESPFPGEITWNFNKFLLDRSGKVVARFDTKVTPEDPQVIDRIKELLAEKE